MKAGEERQCVTNIKWDFLLHCICSVYGDVIL